MLRVLSNNETAQGASSVNTFEGTYFMLKMHTPLWFILENVTSIDTSSDDEPQCA
jgi:hypothetical protein